MLQHSRQAVAVVIGDRGLGRFEGMLAGTVATQLATYGSSPVIVVKGRPEHEGPVVVGVDGSARSLRALEFAADRGRGRHRTHPRPRPRGAALSSWQYMSGAHRRWPERVT
jgi:nucleotide-binding universal stress UspA family protein